MTHVRTPVAVHVVLARNGKRRIQTRASVESSAIALVFGDDDEYRAPRDAFERGEGVEQCRELRRAPGAVLAERHEDGGAVCAARHVRV